MTDYTKTHVNNTFFQGTELSDASKQLLSDILEDGHVYVDADIEVPTFEYNDDGIFEDFIANLKDYEVEPLTNLSITNDDGTGTLDVLTDKLKKLLLEEYNSNRITGAEYTKALQALIAEAMGQAIQFSLQKDSQRYQADKLRLDAINSMYQAMVSKTQIAKVQYETETQKINFLRNKLQTVKDSIELNAAKANLDLLFPIQLNLEDRKINLIEAQTRNAKVQDLLYKQQIQSFRLRDLSQSLAIMQASHSSQLMSNPETNHLLIAGDRINDTNDSLSMLNQIKRYFESATSALEDEINLDLI